MPTATSFSVVRDQPKPRKLGRYELEECLGSEGGLETFRARVRGLAGFDRIFAVKCLRLRRGGPVNLNDPFIKTAKRTAGITDPRVARVLDADVIDGVAIAVTEFVHGMDLDRFRECALVAGMLATGSDDAANKWQKIVAYIGSEVAGGLAAAHGLTPPLAHGGLTPRNLFASARGAIKVLDVGLRWTAQKGGEVGPNRVVGYAAPELATTDANPMSDMLSLGVVLFELATGELPPRGAASAVPRKILDSLWPSMADFIPGLLADDPTVRPTAAEAAKILGDYWADIPDASMVAEMTALVRNFSAFVADASLPKTDAPVAIDTLVPASSASEAPALPPPPSLGSDSAPPPIPFEVNPLPGEAKEDGISQISIDESVDVELSQEQALPAVSASPVPVSRAPSLALPALAASQAVLATEVDDWGARALAALGDQAGVPTSPSAPPARPAIDFSDEPTVSGPRPVADPVVEAAPAFVSATSEGYVPLSDDQDATTVTPHVFDEAPADESPKLPLLSVIRKPAVAAVVAAPPESEAQRAFMAVAFPEGEVGASPLAVEDRDQRPARATVAPVAHRGRRRAARSAVKAQVKIAASSDNLADNEKAKAVGASPGKRVLLLAMVAVAAAGIVGGVTWAFGIWGSKPAEVAKEEVSAVSLPVSEAAPAAAAAVVAPEPSPAAVAAKPVIDRVATDVTITSSPAGATVWIDGQERGTTPLVVKAKRSQLQVVLVRAGYVTAQSTLEVREGAKVEGTLKPVEPPMVGEARFRVECKTLGKLPIVVDGHQTGILCPFSKMRVEPGVHTVGVFVPSTGKIHEKEVTLGPGVRSIALGD